jgi:hypothetical protein
MRGLKTWQPTGAAIGLFVIGAVALAVSGVASAQEDDKPPPCTIKNDGTYPGPGHIKRVRLQPAPNSQIRVVNFGDDRESERASFTVTANRELLARQVRRFNLVADQIQRTGKETAEFVEFTEPTFTKPRLTGDRKRIRFVACLDPPNDLPAGKYTGVITVEGPPGVESTALTITANAKDGKGFLWGTALALAVAGLVLFYKEVADNHVVRMNAATGAEKQASTWWPAVKDSFNLGWFAATIAALVAAFGALYALWDANPAWGEAGRLGSIISLVGIGLAAVGAKTVFTPSTGKSPDRT